jgi:RES domain-containing protein
MIVYRIAKWEYLDDLSGTGARLYGGRWNDEGYPVVYTSEHLSLAVLELLANNIRKLIDQNYGYISIHIPETLLVQSINQSSLSPDWRKASYIDQTIHLGTEWLKSKSSAILHVPSAVLSQEFNLLLNPQHEDFEKIQIQSKEKLNLDGRI